MAFWLLMSSLVFGNDGSGEAVPSGGLQLRYENYLAYPENNWLSTVYGTSNNEKMQFFWKNYH